MVNLYLCQPITSKYVARLDKEFHGYCDASWFKDDIVKCVEEIDNVTYLGRCRFDSDIIGVIGPEDLSGTVKTLVSLCNHPNLLHPCDWLDPSCSPYIKRLSDKYDFLLTLDYCGFTFEPDQVIHVIDWNCDVLGGDLYATISKRGDWDTVVKGLHFQILKDYV